MLYRCFHFQLKEKAPGLSSGNLIKVLVCLTITLASCNSFYWPTTPAPPTFTETNQIRLNTSGSGEGVCGDLSYSITKNFYTGVATSLNLRTVKSMPVIWYKEVYGGALWWFNNSWIWDDVLYSLGYRHTLLRYNLYETSGSTMPYAPRSQFRAQPYYKTSVFITDYLMFDATLGLNLYIPTKNSSQIQCLYYWPVQFRIGFSIQI